MKKIRTALSSLALAILVSVANASSGESEVVYLGDGKYLATRPLWANAYAPNTPENNEDGVNDLNPGDVFSIGALSEATTILINGFPSNLETYEANLQKGDRILVRNERRWIQLLNLHTDNFFDEGVIQKVEQNGRSVTIKYYTNLPSGRVRHEPRNFKVVPGMTVRLEGLDIDAEKAMMTGRHVRFYRPRPQVFLVSDYTGRKDTRGYRGSSQGWVRQGFLRGVSQRTTHFAEFRNGEWINSFAQGKISDLDGYNLGPGGAAAYARPGDRLVTGSRLVGATSTFNTTYGTYAPADDRSVIGEITGIEGNRLTLKVAICPTGLARDGRFEKVQIEIARDARFHLNGKRGSKRSDALKVGSQVRVLASLPAGAALVRDTDPSKMTIEDKPVHPIFPTGRTTSLRFLNQNWRQDEQVEVLENQTARLQVFLYTHGATRFEWRRNGVIIPGSHGTLDSFEVLRLDEYADLSDDGARFTCVATTPAGTVESLPIALRVDADNRPLGLAGAYVAGRNTILLTFNKKVDPRSAQSVTNYELEAKVRRATLIGDAQTVVLETENLQPGASYEVSVKDVIDVSAEPNRIEAGAKLKVTYRVAFRFFRFTLTEKAGLNARLNEFRLHVGSQTFGKDAKAHGTIEKVRHLFDDQRNTYGHFALDEQVTFDLGPGSAIAPDALAFEVTTSTRPVVGYLLEASNDEKTWTQLAEHSGKKLTGKVKHPIQLAALDAEIILQAKKVQTIEFTTPKKAGSNLKLDAKASSGLAVTYAVIEGPGKIEGNHLVAKASGEIRVRAMQAGNVAFYSACPIEQTIHATVNSVPAKTE